MKKVVVNKPKHQQKNVYFQANFLLTKVVNSDPNEPYVFSALIGHEETIQMMYPRENEKSQSRSGVDPSVRKMGFWE